MPEKSKVGSPSRAVKPANATVRAERNRFREELCDADLRKLADLLAKAIKHPASPDRAG